MSDTGAPALTSLSIRNPYASDIAAFVGEVARPFALISMFAAIFIAFVSGKVDPTALGIMVAGGGTLYGVKGTEKIFQTRADADVKKTQVTAESGVSPIIDTAAVAAAADKQIKAADKQTEAADTQMAAAEKTQKDATP